MQNRTPLKPDHLLLKKYLTDAIKAERNDVFQNSFASRFIYYDFKFDSNDKFEILGKLIKKIRICLPVEKKDIEDIDTVPKFPGCLIISFADGTRLIKSITDPEFVNYFKKISQPNKMFEKMGAENLDWERKTVSTIYARNAEHKPKENYEALHGEIILGIYELILRCMRKGLKFPDIVDGGCGNGKFLKKLEQRLRNLANDSKLLGFDFNSDNIDECKNDYKGRCHFRKGNLFDIRKIIRESKENKLLNHDAAIALILSGSLTRLVLKNAFEALLILQQIMNDNIDYIIGGGQAAPFINHFIAKRLGLKPVTFHDDCQTRHFFFYEKMSQTEILQNKINKIKKRNLLDLSLAPNPVRLIRTFANTDYLRNGLVIDLSFCSLTQELIDTLNDINKKYPKIKLIFWHWEESVVLKFFSHFINKFAISVKIVKSESYLMAPRAFFTELQSNLCLFPAKKIEYKESKAELPKDNFQNLGNFFIEFPGEVDRDFVYKYLSMGAKLPLEECTFESEKYTICNVRTDLSLKLIDEALTEKNLLLYFEKIKNEVNGGEFTHLAELLYLYQKGFPRFKQSFVTDEMLVESDLNAELSLYQHLAQIKPDIFNPEVMKIFSEFSLRSKAESSSKEDLEKSKELYSLLWAKESNVAHKYL